MLTWATAMMLASLPLVPDAAPSAMTEVAMAPTEGEQAQPPPAISSPPENSAQASPQSVTEPNEIVVTGKDRPPPGDPLEKLNLQTFKATQVVDKAFVAPVARAYSKVLPKPIRSGARNFFNNLGEPVVFLNYLLQFKPGKAAETFGRFAINSTVGVGGVVDVAKKRPFGLPLRRNGFANTLGYYGVKPGPYFFLPLIGPTTIRDIIGLGVDRLLLPTAIGKPFNRPYYAIPASIITSLDYRVEFDAELRKRNESLDPYAAAREHYLQTRQAEIDALHGGHRAAPAAMLAPIAPALPARAAEPAATTPAGPLILEFAPHVEALEAEAR